MKVARAYVVACMIVFFICVTLFVEFLQARSVAKAYADSTPWGSVGNLSKMEISFSDLHDSRSFSLVPHWEASFQSSTSSCRVLVVPFLHTAEAIVGYDAWMSRSGENPNGVEQPLPPNPNPSKDTPKLEKQDGDKGKANNQP